VIDRLTDTDLTIVAQHAVIDDAGVIENRRGELRRVMADGTVLGRRQVGCELAYAYNVIVARGTITDDAGVIIYTTGECSSGVTGSAIIACRHMVARLTERVGPVVAGIAADRGHQVTGVVDECPDKAIDVMARTTVRDGDRMIEGHTGCRGSIVTGGAGLRHGVEHRVIENAAGVECPDAMAHHAVHARRGVVLCLPDCVNAVMTGGAVTRNGTVVDIRR